MTLQKMFRWQGIFADEWSTGFDGIRANRHNQLEQWEFLLFSCILFSCFWEHYHSHALLWIKDQGESCTHWSDFSASWSHNNFRKRTCNEQWPYPVVAIITFLVLCRLPDVFHPSWNFKQNHVFRDTGVLVWCFSASTRRKVGFGIFLA